jgi:hypothetical protein
VNVLLFGATGMVGQGVLRECLLDPGVQRILAVGRGSTGQRDEKLRELVLPDVAHLADADAELAGFDACFFCLGVSSVGMSEERYTQVTYDLTLAVAQTLARLNAGMTFVYVSGAGTDSSEGGRTMWARVKGRTEKALLRLPFKAAYMFRPAAIVPMHGVRSRTRWYRALYALMTPLYDPERRSLRAGYRPRTGRGPLAVTVRRESYATTRGPWSSPAIWSPGLLLHRQPEACGRAVASHSLRCHLLLRLRPVHPVSGGNPPRPIPQARPAARLPKGRRTT